MRILEVVVRYPPFVGGVEASVHEVARRLAARGHEVRVICADDPPGSPSEVDGVQVVRLPWRFKAANTNLCFGLGEAIRRERPDVIHTHLPTAYFAGRAASAAREMGVPLVLTYHNDVAGEGLKGVVAGIYNRVFLPRLLQSSARIVATNPRHSPRLTNPVCIPWGVETDRFHPPAEEPGPPLTISFLSLLDVHHRYKGLEVLFEALRLLPEVRLRVGGKGEDLAFYQRRAEELGVANRVEFLGFVEDLNAFYGGCHVFALPSTDIREGFGLVLLEAMACGRPVLTTPIVGMAADIERMEAGVLVPPNDPGAVAAALRNPGDLPEMGRRARSLVEERYSWERAALDYERLFLDLKRPPLGAKPP
ncbi:MAG TPA: glycosyltransferase family 4 protein [Thermoanaerobaculia bacterium]|nr:glycosyltransferase family 4 protein [Thermoanaerobaculia bacterium]